FTTRHSATYGAMWQGCFSAYSSKKANHGSPLWIFRGCGKRDFSEGGSIFYAHDDARIRRALDDRVLDLPWQGVRQKRHPDTKEGRYAVLGCGVFSDRDRCGGAWV